MEMRDDNGWHKFDIEDESTWPPEDGCYWIATYLHKYFYDIDGSEYKFKIPISTHGYFYRNEFQNEERSIYSTGWRYHNDKDVRYWKEFVCPVLPEDMREEKE